MTATADLFSSIYDWTGDGTWGLHDLEHVKRPMQASDPVSFLAFEATIILVLHHDSTWGSWSRSLIVIMLSMHYGPTQVFVSEFSIPSAESGVYFITTTMAVRPLRTQTTRCLEVFIPTRILSNQISPVLADV